MASTSAGSSNSDSNIAKNPKPEQRSTIVMGCLLLPCRAWIAATSFSTAVTMGAACHVHFPQEEGSAPFQKPKKLQKDRWHIVVNPHDSCGVLVEVMCSSKVKPSRFGEIRESRHVPR
jgi:hypothetical protein